MKFLRFTPVLLLFAVVLTSCSSVRVASDYDREANFSNYGTYAFFKPGIDKAEISDLDKKRILRAIETEMSKKGFTKSEDPDLLVSIFTKTNENINIYNNVYPYWGYGWGWNPWYWGSGFNTVSSTSEGTLYIDLIDSEGKELVWQGMGTAALAREVNKKQERINEIVSKIMEKYPPGMEK
ncbi:uncharacterized protein DUF4136 [Christiangramia gaetbulicola]|uniref:Uncharacterized protein DUF4136 n=1 Tax=Christiangramia gaetbulicola TaxID=703340 RepID=A0A2T6AKN9_9FLAO|nr:DUF4136 domain-containing protein [Christiangramia gaetbulicola]PTX44393.1 uncharacterized protein DUF4136 [Christiangramia gaetbulicola]